MRNDSMYPRSSAVWFGIVLAIVIATACILLLLGGCTPATQPLPAQAMDVTVDNIDEAQSAIADQAADAQLQAAEVLVPTLVAAQEIIIDALPTAPEASFTTWAMSPAAVDLIVRFEITSPAYYTKRLQRPVWPGGASGVTWGVGYDGGHQPRQRIAADWSLHPAVLRLQGTAGIIGARAKPLAASLRDARTPLPMAQRVFAQSTLPAYDALAARTFRHGWDALSIDARGALTATVYNRGASMRGDKRAEMRTLRDVCVPAGDTACMAAQFRSMTRIWRGTSLQAGLTRRYEATARLAERRA